MANPRKFSEKIALHNQKQAEETAAFEQIMREVIGATRVSSGPQANVALPTQPQPIRNNHLNINQSVGTLRTAGSLPNVNRIAEHSSINLRDALDNLDAMQHGRETRERTRTHSPGASVISRSGHLHTGNGLVSSSNNVREHRRSDTRSPYSQPYLSPPDTNWRRTNSDSALHHSAMLAEQQDINLYAPNSPSSPRRSTVPSNSYGYLDHGQYNNIHSTASNQPMAAWDPGKQNHHQHDFVNYSTSPESTALLTPSHSIGSRPKSCEVPGIAIYPTQEDSNQVANQIPLSSNTGSLPDLANLHHYPAPLATPIDAEDQSVPVHQGNDSSTNNNSPNSPYGNGAPPPSPYSTTSNCGSPYSPQSPHSVSSAFSPPPITQHHNLTGGNMYDISDNGNMKGQMLNNHHSSLPNGIPSHSVSSRHSQVSHHVVYSSPKHTTSPPMITVEGLTVDTSALSLGGNSPIYVNEDVNQIVCMEPNSRQQQTTLNGQIYHQQNTQQQQMGLHRSSTPSEHSCSAPTSPISHSMSPLNSPAQQNGMSTTNSSPSETAFNVQQASVLQHQFEQFKMAQDAQNEVEKLLMMPESMGHSSSSSASSSNGTISTNSHATKLHQRSPKNSVSDGTSDFSPQPSPQSNYIVTGLSDFDSAVFYSASGLLPLNNSTSMSPSIYSNSVISSAPSSDITNRPPIQSPQTPTSIPDIIVGPYQDHDLGTTMISSFEASDLFNHDFRGDTLDFDELQIFPRLNDSPTEESLRVDRS
ncbi:CREB-regulated transcription coactivator 1 [Halotydeus destructor]|nr:CREB-regulated transcription coactivator 1 [Halotydeus destructor]